MSIVRINDASMRQITKSGANKLSFKNKLELAKLLDRLGISVIELDAINEVKADSLLIKSIATSVKNSTVAVPVELNKDSVDVTWSALQTAKKARLVVEAPVSTVQMEYLYHKKPSAVIEAVKETVAHCRAYTEDVEFVANDATRSEESFLYEIVKEAIKAGAQTVTVCDAAGSMLPDEFAEFLEELIKNVPELHDVTLSVSCSDTLAMANACTVEAVRKGAREVKVAVCTMNEIASLPAVVSVLAAKGSEFDVTCAVQTVELNRVVRQIEWLCFGEQSKTSPFDSGVRDDEENVILSSHDDLAAVLKAVEDLGYELSEEDGNAVWEAFCQIASRKEQIGSKELDAIVASAAMQVPATYKLDSFVINSGNIISATAHVTLIKDDKKVDSVALGDGPVDAAFLALEQIAGTHYELDDFQIRSVTRGHEAMGETVVRLRSNGKLYAGRGISTDIIGASIRAYVNALNKIVYEEAE